MRTKPSVSRFFRKRKAVGRIYPMGLIFTSMLVLSIPGILFNNFSTSGLNPIFALTCHGPFAPGQNPDFTCQNSIPAGCQATPASCTLQNNNVGFLNGNSPFTDLLRGNYLSFLFSLSGVNPANSLSTQSAFQVTGFGTSNLVPGVCLNEYDGNASATYGYKPVACDQVGTNGIGISPTNAIRLQPAPGSYNQTAIPLVFLAVTNASDYTLGTDLQAINCNLLASYSFTTGAGGPRTYLDYMDGCQYYSTQNHHTTYWYYNANINGTGGWASANKTGGAGKSYPYQNSKYNFNYCNAHSGLNTTGTTPDCPAILVPVTLQPENWDVFSCGIQEFKAFNSGTYFHQQLGSSPPFFYNPLVMSGITPQCSAMLQSIANFNAQTSASFGLAPPILWVLGIALFIIGTGLNLRITGSVFGTGGGVGIGVNRQGTKMAQVLGLALVTWTPLYSEFATWFTSGLLPNGLDGALGIVSVLIAGLFFGGVFWQATQD